jgi:hypothetical protein
MVNRASRSRWRGVREIVREAKLRALRSCLHRRAKRDEQHVLRGFGVAVVMGEPALAGAITA